MTGIETLIAMPLDAPEVTRVECALAGSPLYLVEGLIGEAGRLIGEAVERDGYFDASTLKEPYRLEGKKTMDLEIAEQLGWSMPDVVVYPTGGGVGLIGIDTAITELRELGWLDQGNGPRFVSEQAAGRAPIVRAFEAGAEVSLGRTAKLSPLAATSERPSATFWCSMRFVAAAVRPSRSMARPRWRCSDAAMRRRESFYAPKGPRHSLR